MLKEACAASALVAAALVPSMTSQAAQAEKVRAAATPAKSTSLTNCTSWRAPKCKWLEQKNQRCLYCRGKKGSGYKRQYCEKKPTGPMQRECVQAKEPIPGNPERYCSTCRDPETGKVVSKTCVS
jgi:hypothetical protein